MSIFEVDIDIDGDGDFDDANEDVSAYVNGLANVTCSRGKERILLYSPPAAGRFNAMLMNHNRVFSPGVVDSFVYGKRLPGRKVRWLTAGGGGGTTGLEGSGGVLLETGGGVLLEGTPKRVISTTRLDRFIHHPELENRSVELSTLGMMSRLVGKNVSTQVYQGITTSDAISVILDKAGWPALERSIQTGLTTLDWWWWSPDNGDAYQAIIELFLTEGPGAALYENPDGWIVFENRDARTTQSRSTMSQATYSGSDPRVQPPFEYNDNDQDTIEACGITVEERAPQPLAEIWRYDSEIVLGPNQSRTFNIKTGEPFINAPIPNGIASNTIFTLTGSQALTSGGFKLEYLGIQTAVLNYNLTAGDAQTALEDLYGVGNVSCTGGPLNIRPIFCELSGGAYAGENITSLPTVVDSTLNPHNIPGGITVTKKQAADGGLIEIQIFTPSGVLVSGTWAAEITFLPGTFQTVDLPHNATATDIRDAFRDIFGLEQTVCFFGPVNTSDVEVRFVDISSAPIANVVIIPSPTDPLMMQEPGATVDIAVSQQGGIADYVITAGSLYQVMLDPQSGTGATLIYRADTLGVTLAPGSRVRAQSISVVSTQDVIYPENIVDGEDIKIYRPSIRAGVSRATAETIAMLYVLYYINPRPSIVLTIENSIYKADMDAELAREISDRVTVALYQLGIDEDYFVEQIEHSLVGTKMITRLGLEKAMAA